jgi:hypothetical protein
METLTHKLTSTRRHLIAETSNFFSRTREAGTTFVTETRQAGAAFARAARGEARGWARYLRARLPGAPRLTPPRQSAPKSRPRRPRSRSASPTAA